MNKYKKIISKDNWYHLSECFYDFLEFILSFKRRYNHQRRREGERHSSLGNRIDSGMFP